MALYDAFISYSHVKDKPIASALQSVVQKLGKPWYRRRALRVFRDDTSLSATPHLWPTIEQSLAQSRYLILLASPEAAASHWVGKEIAYWLECKSADTLLIAVTSGALAWDNAANDFAWREDTPLPPALKGRFAAEPKWVDLTAYRDGADRGDAKFTELAADFAAAIRGMPKEDLLSQEVRQQRRALTLAWSGVASLLVLAGLAAWQWMVAIDNERAATRQKQVAEQQSEIARTEGARAERNFGAAKTTIDAVIFDLVGGLKDVEGMRAETARRILDRAEAAVAQLVSKTEQDPAIQSSQATMYRLFSDLTLALGATDAALDYAQRSVGIRRALAAAEPADSDRQQSLVVSLARVVEALVARGDFSGALPVVQECLDISRARIAANPNETAWQRLLSASLNQLGGIRRSQGDPTSALAAYREALDIRRSLAAASPEDLDAKRDVSNSLENVGAILTAQRNLAGALAAYQEGLGIRREISLKDPDNTQWRRDVALSLGHIGRILADQDDVSGALAAFRESVDIHKRLAAKDPGNTRWQRDLSVSLDDLADLLLRNGDSDQALTLYREALGIFRRLVAKDPDVSNWQIDLFVSLEKIGGLLATQGDRKAALTSYRESLEIRRALVVKEPGRPRLQRDVAICLLTIGDLLAESAENEAAVAAYRESLDISRVLATKYPDNLEWQRDLSVALDRVGDVALAQGHDRDAEAMYRESLGIRRALADKEPGKTQHRREISISLGKIGDALLARKDLLGAATAYREALDVIRTLVAQRPDRRAAWQADLTSSADKIGTVASYFVLARNFSQSLELSDEAIAAAPDLVWLHANRAHALMFLGKVDQARAIYLQYRGMPDVQDDKPWETVVLEDFAELRKAGLKHPLMDEIEKTFAKKG